MPLALGIDIGTSSVKAVLVDEAGQIVARAVSREYPLLTPRPQWVEQNPLDWWQATCETTRQILKQSSRHPSEVAGVGLSGQMNGAVYVDRQGQPLGPAPIWLDHRSVSECEWAESIAGEAIRGAALNPPQPVYTAAKLLWAARHDPDLFRQAHMFLEPKDFVRFRLTGTLGTDISDASATLLLDLLKREWAYEVWAPLGIRPDIFPPLARSIDLVGGVTSEAASGTGLVVGTPVVAGGADMACQAAGSGVVIPGVVSVTIGTAGHVTAAARHISDAGYNRIYPMCHVVPDQYFWLGCVFSGGLSYRWFRDALGEPEITAARRAGMDPYDLLNEEAARIPPGSEGLFFLPWLTGSATPYPDGNARGAFIGLSLRHGKPHMARAVMEGIAYNLRDSLEIFQELGLAVEKIFIGEGGSRSALWRQIQADIFARDLTLLATGDASPLGAALIAGVGVGLFPDFEIACQRTVRLGEITHPIPENVSRYEAGYRIFQGFYPALKGSFARMAGWER